MGRKRIIRHGSIFSGIGGFDLAAEWVGWKTAFHCEIDDFCNKVLEYYWPDAEAIKNIMGYEWEKWKGKVDVLSGGWPCQKYSVAGSRSGNEPLKDAMLDTIRTVHPAWCVLENVYGFITKKFADEHSQLCEQLEDMGYRVQTLDIDGASVGIPTMERHVWIIASSYSERLERNIKIPLQDILQLPEPFQRGYPGKARRWQLSQSRTGKLGEGISDELDTTAISKRKWHAKSLQAFGNAIIPQIAFYIFRAIHNTIYQLSKNNTNENRT
jgi:site-specific DNA-cytosine methylase